MRSARSRLALVTSLGSAGRGVERCVDALPVPTKALKYGAAVVAGLAGVTLLRALFSRRSATAVVPAVAPAASPHRQVGRYLFSETVLTLLLPLCRRYLLGADAGTLSHPGGLLGRFLHKGR